MQQEHSCQSPAILRLTWQPLGSTQAHYRRCQLTLQTKRCSSAFGITKRQENCWRDVMPRRRHLQDHRCQSSKSMGKSICQNLHLQERKIKNETMNKQKRNSICRTKARRARAAARASARPCHSIAKVDAAKQRRGPSSATEGPADLHASRSPGFESCGSTSSSSSCGGRRREVPPTGNQASARPCSTCRK